MVTLSEVLSSSEKKAVDAEKRALRTEKRALRKMTRNERHDYLAKHYGYGIGVKKKSGK
jgi:hypothetical protein